LGDRHEDTIVRVSEDSSHSCPDTLGSSIGEVNVLGVGCETVAVGDVLGHGFTCVGPSLRVGGVGTDWGGLVIDVEVNSSLGVFRNEVGLS